MANEDKSARYHRLRRRASVFATLTSGLLLIVLLFSGAAVAIRVVTDQITGGTFVLSASIYAVMLVVMSELVALPLAYYQGMTLERRYGLATQTTAHWLRDRCRTVGVAAVLAVVVTLLIELLMRWAPDWWWLLATVTMTLLLVALVYLAPVVLMPLFYTFRPLDRPALSARLLALAQRAGTQVLGVFEWQLSDRTRKANAALAGIGRTRRILVSDTLLTGHSDDEIEVILAHELGHHVHRDIWSGLALESVLVGVGLFAADRLLTATSGWFGFTGKDDIAALPLLVLAAGTVSLVLMPIANALSRSHERRADRYALQLTENPTAFVSAMKRLSTQNLAEEEPPRVVEWLFHSHPPTSARIAAALAWKRSTST
jgi:STE24 endopeptidase